MGTTAEKLARLQQTKADIRSAIVEKGQDVAETDPFSDYADKIRNIQSGGSADAPVQVDALELYNRLRPSSWPPFQEDLHDLEYIMLFKGQGTPFVTYYGDGGATVTLVLAYESGGVWKYATKETVSLADGEVYTHEALEGTTQARYLLRIQLSDISDTLDFTDNDYSKNVNCVEIYTKLPDNSSAQIASLTEELPDIEFFRVFGQGISNKYPPKASGCPNLKVYYAPGYTVLGGFGASFLSLPNLLAAKFNMNPPAPFNGNTAFQDCPSLRQAPFSEIVNPAQLYNVFRNCFSMVGEITVDFQYSRVVKFSLNAFAFYNCYNLYGLHFKGTATIVSVVTLTNCFSLSRLTFDLPSWTGTSVSIINANLAHKALIELFNSLPVSTAKPKLTITGNPGVPELTDEDKAIVTDKGWKLVI